MYVNVCGCECVFDQNMRVFSFPKFLNLKYEFDTFIGRFFFFFFY